LAEGGTNMYVTATEFKNHLGEYLDIALKEEVIITRNKKERFRLSPYGSRSSIDIESLFGILPSDINEKKILADKPRG